MGIRNQRGLTVLLLFVISATSLTVSALFLRKDSRAVKTALAAETAESPEAPDFAAGNGQTESCPVGMIAYWHLDETSGTTFVDRIQGINASCTGNQCPAFVQGRVNGALAFDGINDRVSAPNHPDFDWLNNDSFSLELWAKTSSCDDGVFFGKQALNRATWWLGCGSTGHLPVFGLRDSNGFNVWITGTTSIADNEWHHLVAVREAATQQNRLYVDGSLSASATINYAGDFNNINNLTFGYHADQWFVNATIDEVAAYDRVLTAQEITRHYVVGRDAGHNYCNMTPAAFDGSFETEMGVSVQITFDYNDPDGPGPYTVTIVDGPDHGALTGSGLQRTYAPNAGFKGTDFFTWRISDGVNDSNVATTTINVLGLGENVPPVAESQAVTANNKSPLLIELSYTDPDGGSVYTVTIIDGPDHGTLSGTGATRTYHANSTFVGHDSFTWKVNDGFDDSNVATVSIQVVEGNVPPVAQSQSLSTGNKTPLLIELTYTDADGGTGYMVTIVDGPDHGTLTGTGTTRTYRANSSFVGNDSFTWKVNDGFADSNVAAVSIQVFEAEAYLYLPFVARP